MTCDWWSSRGSIVTAAESAKTKPKTGWAEYDLYDIVKQLQVRPWVCCDHRNTDAAGTGASANTQTRARASFPYSGHTETFARLRRDGIARPRPARAVPVAGRFRLLACSALRYARSAQVPGPGPAGARFCEVTGKVFEIFRQRT